MSTTQIDSFGEAVSDEFIPIKASLETYQKEYLNREDGFKYEFVNGEIEIREKMNQLHAEIFMVLLEFFNKTKAFARGDKLIQETNVKTSPSSFRIPDILFFTKEQRKIIRSGATKDSVVPSFVAEIVSHNDRAMAITQKVPEYFSAGVQLVWYIYPESREVHVYTNPNAIKICRSGDTCSGAPVLPDLLVPVDELLGAVPPVSE